MEAQVEELLEENDQSNILDDPVHGIYIPVGIFILGIIILIGVSRDYRIFSFVPLFVAIIVVRAVSAWWRSRSLYTNKWSSLELEDQTLVSKNTAIYRFRLKTRLESLKFLTGQYVLVKVNIGGTDFVRSYNPISSDLQQGYLDLMVKSYPEGIVSKYFASLKPGDTVSFKGPFGKGVHDFRAQENIGFVAGGSGITPALQLLNEIITEPKDLTKVSLIYANNTENDILLRDELDDMADKYPHFKVHYVLNNPTNGWNSDVGLVTKEMMEKHLPSPVDKSRLFVCGPDAMNDMIIRYADELGWGPISDSTSSDGKVHVFQEQK